MSSRKRLLGAVAAMVALVLVSTPAHAATGSNCVAIAERLEKGDYISRTLDNDGGRVRLIMQTDGNLVLYWSHGKLRRTCWTADTTRRGHHAVYQKDGIFAVYDAAGRMVWASDTAGERASRVQIKDAGRLYVGDTPITQPCP
jgi:hypothetical protein